MVFIIMMLSFGLPLAIVAFIFSLIGYKKQGVWFWTLLFILLKGRKSTAQIIDSINKVTNIRINKSPQYMYTVVMDVTDPYLGQTYRVKKKYMDYYYSVLGNKNTEVPVIIHPTDSETVIIDFKTLRKNQKQAMEQNYESEENRLNHLMNG